jgi:hypothetical protein
LPDSFFTSRRFFVDQVCVHYCQKS